MSDLENQNAELIEQINSLQAARGRMVDEHFEEKKELKEQLAKAKERLKELEQELIQADSANLELSFALNKVKDFVTFDFEGKDECLSRLSRIISSEQQQAHMNLNKFAIEQKIEGVKWFSEQYCDDEHWFLADKAIEQLRKEQE